MDPYDPERAQEYFRSKLAFTAGPFELDELVRSGRDDVVVVDVRYPADYARGHVPGAINLPKGRWHGAKGLRPDATHYLYCYDQTCHKAAEAALELARQGFRVVEVEGGWAAWVASGYAVDAAAAA